MLRGLPDEGESIRRKVTFQLNAVGHGRSSERLKEGKELRSGHREGRATESTEKREDPVFGGVLIEIRLMDGILNRENYCLVMVMAMEAE
jgi:hypothetical protein